MGRGRILSNLGQDRFGWIQQNFSHEWLGWNDQI